MAPGSPSATVDDGENPRCTIRGTLPSRVILELQNRPIISVVHSHDHFGAPTSSGKPPTWDNSYEGGRGQAERPPRVTVLSEARFGHGLKTEGRVERYCFAAAAGLEYKSAFVIDLAGDVDEVPPEDLEQHFETTLPCKKVTIQTARDQENCCLV